MENGKKIRQPAAFLFQTTSTLIAMENLLIFEVLFDFNRYSLILDTFRMFSNVEK